MAGWEKNVRSVVPYVPGEQPKNKNVIKLNTNENPYPPAPGVLDVLQHFPADNLRKYPDPTAQVLVDAIGARYGVDADHIFVGVGSDDVLAQSFLTFFNGEKTILFPDITYSFYDVWADLFRIPYETVPLDDDFRIHPEDYRKPNGGIVIPNPNAPTGLDAGREALEEIIAGNPDSVVIIDEAYVDFGARSVLDLIDKYENLLVVQTFSKSRALAGSRIGFAFGSKQLIKALNDVKFSYNSYTMDQVTQRIGAAAMADEAYFTKRVNQIVATREWTKEKLQELGFTFPDSKTNFIFATHPKIQAAELFADLKKSGIYVRYFDKPRINNYLRITVGTDEEMQALIDFLSEYVRNL